MMKKIYIFILLQMLSSLALAGSFFQVINLHTTPINKGRWDAICFTTTDLFDGSHCEDYAANYYSSGPKNWKIFSKENKNITMDASCKSIVSTTQRTPEESGLLDIFVTIDKEPYRQNYTMKNCYTHWQPVKA